MHADVFAIKIKITCLPDAFKFEKYVLSLIFRRNGKVFPVPGNTGGEAGNVFFKGHHLRCMHTAGLRFSRRHH